MASLQMLVVVLTDKAGVNVKVREYYLFASMMIQGIGLQVNWQIPKMHDADNISRMIKQMAGRSPRIPIINGLSACKKAVKNVFGKKTGHRDDVGIRGRKVKNRHIATAMFHPTNNKMEGLYDEIRD